MKPDPGVIFRFLDAIETMILRMLTGVFHFVFRKIPRWVYDFLVEWFPTVTKAVRVAIFATVLACIVVGPAAAAYYWLGVKATEEAPTGAQLTDAAAAWLKYGGYLWSAVAATGAVWGFIYIRKRARGLWAAIKNAIRKRQSELEVEDPELT